MRLGQNVSKNVPMPCATVTELRRLCRRLNRSASPMRIFNSSRPASSRTSFRGDLADPGQGDQPLFALGVGVAQDERPRPGRRDAASQSFKPGVSRESGFLGRAFARGWSAR